MHIQQITIDPSNFPSNEKLVNSLIQFQQLIIQLNQKDLPVDLIQEINLQVHEINKATCNEQSLQKLLRSKQAKIISLSAKHSKIVPINYYRNIWMALGMTAFGLPIGVSLGLSLGNIGLLGIGLPIGLAMGVGIGLAMDKKAKDEGRQLDVEIKM